MTLNAYDELLGKGAGQETAAAQPEPATPEPLQTPEPASPSPPGEQVSAAPPVETPQTPVAQEPAAPPAARNEWLVPGQALLSEREARKSVAQERDELKRRLDEIARRDAEAKATLPDPLVDSDAFVRGIREEVQAVVNSTRQEAREMVYSANERSSSRYWSERLGDNWGAMNEWLAKQPDSFKAQMRAQDDPYGTAHHYWSRASTIERLGGNDLDAWFEQEAAKRGYARAAEQTQPVTPTPAPQSPPAPVAQPQRRSVTSLAEVSGSVPSSPSEVSGYDALFRK